MSLGLTLLYLNAYNALGQIPPTYGYGYGNSVTVQFASSSYTVNENAGTTTLTLTLNAAAANTVNVNYATSDGTAVAGTDYVAASGTVTFNPGVTSQTIKLGIIDNGSDTNQSVQFAVTMSQPSSNAALGTPSTTTVNILDNDPPPPLVQFSSVSYSVNENAGAVTIAVTISAPSQQQVSVDYATSDGTATAPNEYQPASGTLTFSPGATSQSFNVAIVDDGVYEPNDTIELTLSNPTNALLGSQDCAEITILDTDGPPPGSPTVQYSSESYTVSDTAGTATITVTLSAASSSTITVNYATSDDTAIVPDDYQPASGTLTFAPGQTAQSFNVSIVNNAVYQSDRTVDLALSNPTNASLGNPSTATLDITQSAPPPNTPTVQFSSAAYSVNENAGTATITANLSAASTQTVTINYATSDGTATAPNEYQPASGTLTFSPGATSQSFNVAIVDDGVYEPNDTIDLNLSDPINATLGDNYSAILTILDDSSPPLQPTVQFSQSSYSANEFDGTATITVNLSAGFDQVVSVAYSTSDGTAQTPTNYMPASGVLTFSPGDTSQTFTVEILDDPGITTNLYLNLALSSPTNATLGSPMTAVLNIAPQPDSPYYVTISRLVDGRGAIAPISAANKNQDVLPGQKIDLYASVGPVAAIPAGATITYKWTLPGVVFRDYTANQSKGVLSPMTDEDLSGGVTGSRSLAFYWADAGDGREVVCTATINGQKAQGKATLNVKAPTIAGFSAKDTIGTIQKSADGQSVGLYAAGGVEPGISFGNVTVTVPAGFAQGQWNFVQIVKQGNTRTLGGGTRQQGNNYGEWVLDTTYPYEPAPYRSYPTPGEPAGSYATGNTPHTVTDTPATPLLPATLRDTGMKNQQWEMYVMFLPPGVDGRYVPLKKIAWNVNCNVTNGAGGWNISAGATQNAGDATITSVHPQWTANVVKPFEWVKAP